ncbi:uncharacterized protein LOC129563309 [Moschus berezovskii]|uniref:uncharacterized protein LOC129563309 n=1 Tax=Moschus berezovskii TaxID=68408 RepID=UPI0024448085|nr:uncharacterized protein LOC129563309 [Moschus berezovskii]
MPGSEGGAAPKQPPTCLLGDAAPRELWIGRGLRRGDMRTRRREIQNQSITPAQDAGRLRFPAYTWTNRAGSEPGLLLKTLPPRAAPENTVSTLSRGRGRERGKRQTGRDTAARELTANGDSAGVGTPRGLSSSRRFPPYSVRQDSRARPASRSGVNASLRFFFPRGCLLPISSFLGAVRALQRGEPEANGPWGSRAPRTVGRARGALQAFMSVQIHAVENVSAFPYECIVWVLKDPDCRGQRSLTASAPEWAARICLKPQSSELQRRKCWVEGAHSRMPLRASRPLGLGLDFATICNTAAVLGAALLEAGRDPQKTTATPTRASRRSAAASGLTWFGCVLPRNEEEVEAPLPFIDWPGCTLWKPKGPKDIYCQPFPHSNPGNLIYTTSGEIPLSSTKDVLSFHAHNKPVEAKQKDLRLTHLQS